MLLDLYLFVSSPCQLPASSNTFRNSIDFQFAIPYGIAVGYGLDGRGFDSLQELRIFFFTTASRRALGPIQPPIQWVPGSLSLGLKWSSREADHSPPSNDEVKE
jgi:hypothetical protein